MRPANIRGEDVRPFSAKPGGMLVNIGLGVVFALGIVFTAFMLIDSWGGASWVFGSAVSITVGVLALLRVRQKMLTAVAGLVVTAGAVTVSLIVGDGLPQEPAPITALALSVLVGSAIRTLPMGAAAGIAAGGVVVTGVIWLDGASGVTSLATMLMVGGLIVGPLLRSFAPARGSGARAAESSPPGRARQ